MMPVQVETKTLKDADAVGTKVDERCSKLTKADGKAPQNSNSSGIDSRCQVAEPRSAGPFATRKARRRYWIIVAILVVIGLAAIYGNLAWANPMPHGTDGFWRIARLRTINMLVIGVVSICQALATVTFQTTTGNRIITPSLMGFESLYTLIQTAAIFFFGSAGLIYVQGTAQFVVQVALMVVFAGILYGWLLGGKYSNMQIMLLIGIILGSAMGAMANFMQRLLDPMEYDLLQARLIGSISNSDADYLPLAIPLVVIGIAVLYWQSPKLDALALGKQVATNLGVNYKRSSMLMLLLVSILMAVSTSLVGPLTFFGFLSAMIAYQLADTYSHRYLLPMASLVGFVILSCCYFILKHVFYAEGSVSVIIEMIGGTFFLIYLFRKGKL